MKGTHVMATIFDVSKYILEKKGCMTAMKLQKLAFYVKAWGLVWDEDEIFPEEFQAWANGAVSPVLYEKHRDLFKVDAALFPDANSEIFKDYQIETIEKVLNFYDKYTAQQLIDINRQESPWIDARDELPPTARSNPVITPASMCEYYSGL